MFDFHSFLAWVVSFLFLAFLVFGGYCPLIPIFLRKYLCGLFSATPFCCHSGWDCPSFIFSLPGGVTNWRLCRFWPIHAFGQAPLYLSWYKAEIFQVRRRPDALWFPLEDTHSKQSVMPFGLYDYWTRVVCSKVEIFWSGRSGILTCAVRAWNIFPELER